MPIGSDRTSKGSPPHTRGQGIASPSKVFAERITPAHAGTSRCTAQSERCPEDHPRTRGDKYSFRKSLVAAAGSPPHTRGQVFILSIFRTQPRITPAHAGTRSCARGGRLGKWDHPRTRGDKIRTQCNSHALPGSPPHTRGQAVSHRSKMSQGGITPAHAGTSAQHPGRGRARKDHPRTRGDKYPARVFG